MQLESWWFDRRNRIVPTHDFFAICMFFCQYKSNLCLQICSADRALTLLPVQANPVDSFPPFAATSFGLSSVAVVSSWFEPTPRNEVVLHKRNSDLLTHYNERTLPHSKKGSFRELIRRSACKQYTQRFGSRALPSR